LMTREKIWAGVWWLASFVSLVTGIVGFAYDQNKVGNLSLVIMIWSLAQVLGYEISEKRED
jgi:hypothetical protein